MVNSGALCEKNLIYNQCLLWIMKIGLPEAKIWWNAFLHYNSHSGTHLSGLVLTNNALSLPTWSLILSITIRVELLCTWNEEIWSGRRLLTSKTGETGHLCGFHEYECDVTMACDEHNMIQYYVWDS